jgi:hypothetical protein
LDPCESGPNAATPIRQKVPAEETVLFHRNSQCVSTFFSFKKKETRMIKVVISAAALSLLVCANASALPAPKSQLAVPSSDLVEAGKKYDGKKRGYKHGHYKHDAYKHSYKHAPRGWRSYSYRPWGWERRGCIVIGPVWYCP